MALILVLHHSVLLARGSAQRFLWEDFLEYNYPVRSLAAAWLARGSLALWNPYFFAGMPLLGDVAVGSLYPPNVLLAAFVRDGVLSFPALEWSVCLHVLFAGLGMFLLARRLLGSLGPAVLAGTTFMLSGFFTTQIIHLNIVQVASWLPWSALVFHEALSRRSPRWALGAGVCVGVASLAGLPQISLYLVMVLGLQAAVTGLRGWRTGTSGPDRRRRALVPLALLAVALVATLGIVAPQLLPSKELGDHCVRSRFTLAESAEASFGPQSFVTLLLPKFFGQAHGRDWSSYWGPGSYFHFWELAGYLGIVPLLLALLALRRFREASRLTVIVVFFFGLLLAMGKFGPLHPVLYYALPGYDRLRIPGRALIMFVFAGSLLAGFGLQDLVRRWEARAEARSLMRLVAGLAAFTLLAAAGVLLWHRGELVGGTQWPAAWSRVVRGCGLFLALSALFLLVDFMVRRRRLAPRAGWAAMVLVTAFDLMAFGGNYSAGVESPRDFLVKGREPAVRLLLEDQQREMFRVNARPAEDPSALLLRRNQGPLLGISTIEGYNQMKLASFERFDVPLPLRLDLLNVKYRTLVDRADGALVMVLNATYLPRAFYVPEALFLTSEDEVLERMRATDFDPRQQVLMLGPPEAGDRPIGSASKDPAGASWSAAMAVYEPNRLVVDLETSREGYLALSEVYYPDWRARVDGRDTRLWRADYCLRAVAVPAGRHRIEVYMAGEALRHGVALGASTLVLAVLLVVAGEAVSARSRRRPADGGEERPGGRL